MNITLSWDLFVLVFFVVIVAYSFIIGRDNTLKVILGTYVAALAADAAGNLFAHYFMGAPLFTDIVRLAELGNDAEVVVFTKVMIFVVLVILFAVKGAFTVETDEGGSPVIKMVLSVFYAVMSAGLIISVILVFVSGIDFVGGGNDQTTTTALFTISNKSQIIKAMLDYTYIWFSLPALAFLIHSLQTPKE